MLFVDDVGIFAETFVHFHAIEQTQLHVQHRVDGVGLYKWDAAPRTEHAVLAAGEALEVTAAAHFCCVSWLFCLLIAPLRATSGQPPKLCAVFTACGQSQLMQSFVAAVRMRF
jgi:hypothetical protein